jgi:NADH:ubiquinone oxidoreductase subunit 3 (subunit A)
LEVLVPLPISLSDLLVTPTTVRAPPQGFVKLWTVMCFVVVFAVEVAYSVEKPRNGQKKKSG